jgi:hypothetical protein
MYRFLQWGVDQVDLLAAILCIVGGLTAIGISVLIGGGQEGLGAALAISGILYLFVARDSLSLDSQIAPNKTIVKIVSVLFVIAFLTGTIIGTYLPYQRPVAHFFLFGIAASLLIWLIYYTRQTTLSTLTILFIIVIYSAAFRIIRFTNYSTIPGSDLHFHYRFNRELIIASGLPITEFADSKYLTTPIWHLWTSSVEFVTGTTHEGTILGAIVIPFTLVTVLSIYVTAARFTANREVALLAALLVSVADMFILRGTTSITPSSLVIPFTCLIVFLTLKKSSSRYISLILLFVLVSILTHQLSTFTLFVVLVSIYTGIYIYNYGVHKVLLTDQTKTLWSTILISVLVLFVVWGYASYDGRVFFDSMVVRLFTTLTGISNQSGDAAYAGPSSSLLSDLLYDIGYTLLFGLGIFGLLYTLGQKQRTQYSIGFVFAAGAIFTIIYPMTIAGFDQLFLPHRMLAFLQLFIVLYAGITLHFVIGKADDRKQLVLVSVFVFLLVFGLLTTPFLNRNTPVYNEDRVERTELTEMETSAHLWLVEHRTDGIYTDPHVTNREIRTEVLRQQNEVPPEFDNFGLWSNEHGDLVMLREHIENKQTIVVTGTFGQSTTLEISNLLAEMESNSKVYDNGNDQAMWSTNP